MNLPILIITSAAISFDAFLTLFSGAKTYLNASLLKRLSIAVLFALLHAAFALLGYSVSKLLAVRTDLFEIAESSLFCILGIFALFDNDEKPEKADLKTVLLQAAATSFDAFLGGLTLITVARKSYLVFVFIFIICFIFSGAGLFLGRRVSLKNGKPLKYVSAAVFFTLAVKALVV